MGYASPDKIARRYKQRGSEGKQSSARNPAGARLSHHHGACETRQRESDARRSDLFAKEKGRSKNQNQRCGLEDGDHIGDRHSSQSHDVAEGAERFGQRPQQRTSVQGSGDSVPFPSQRDQCRADETRGYAAKKKNLEGRQVLGNQLQETIAYYENSGRCEHGNDAAQVRGLVHGVVFGERERYCQMARRVLRHEFFGLTY